jgi:hypothetical protein
MRRLLCALLLAITTISHGTVGAEVPHADGTIHADSLFDHHQVEAEAPGLMADDSSSTNDPADKGTPALSHHVHIAADAVPNVDLVLAPPVTERVLQRLFNDASLHSAALDPPAEPPSA